MKILGRPSPQPLDAIADLCRDSVRIEKSLTEAVLAARASGHSWTDIGRSLGSTKQAAWRRFARGPMAERFAADRASERLPDRD